jgi:hypothetical protein
MRATHLSVGLITGLVLVAAVPMGAQTPGQTERKLELAFDGQGYVTLTAQNVSVSEIFAEWTRVGGTRIVNADRLPRTLVAVQFDRMPENSLVASLIRLSKAQNPGYVAAPRLASAVPTPSRLGLIQIMPTSSPTMGYTNTTAVSQAYPVNSSDDELPPVMPVTGTGPATPPPPAAQPNRGPGVFVPPPISPGSTGRGGGGGSH